VFRAYDPERDRLVAVKLFRLDLPPERVHQLAAELDALVTIRLTHPAIATPLSAGIAGVEAYLGQDFIAAESLDLVFRECGPTPPADALRVATQLASALDFAAAGNVVHGSLHPRDVLISLDEARLTGIGISRALERVGATAPLRRPYTAPERARGGAWDRRADVFSLAVIAHEMLWGRRLAGAGDQAVETLTEIEGGDLVVLRQVFGRALAEDPEHRFGAALDFIYALAEAFPHVAHVVRSRSATARTPIVQTTAAMQDYDVELKKNDEPLIEPQDEVDVSRDGHIKENQENLEAVDAPLFSDAPLFPDTPVVDPPVEHVLSYVDRVSSANAAAVAAEDLEPSNSSMGIRPLGLALLLGVAIGFAGGYGMGYQVRPEEMATTINELAGSSSPTLLAMAADPPRPAPREFTEEKLLSPPVPTPAVGRIVVRSRPAGARVFINGRDVGRTPLAMGNLSRGAHDVRLERDGYTAVERHVVVSASKPESQLTVALARALPPSAAPTPNRPAARAPGSLGVDSRPSGAKVFVDGKLAGTTPLSLTTLAPGEYAVRLERDGYRSWASTVHVAAGESQRVAASLEGDAQTPPVR